MIQLIRPRLSRKPQLLIRPMKHDKLTLQKDIPVDRKRYSCTRLNPAITRAGCTEFIRVRGRVPDQLPGDHSCVAPDVDGDLRQLGVAVKYPTPLVGVVYRAGDLAVVEIGHVGGDKEEGRARVHDGVVDEGVGGAAVDGDGRGGEFPEAA